jgi:type I restriction enzyme S subunit
MSKKERNIEELLQEALVPEEEKPYEVPENWMWVRLGSVVNFFMGSAFPNHFQGHTHFNIPFYKVGSLKDVDSDYYILNEDNTISEEMRIQLKAKLVPKDTILFAKIGEAIRLNRRSIVSTPACIDNNLMGFRGKEKVLENKFLLFWSLKEGFYKYSQASAVPSIRKSTMENITIPLPPLSEQKRIVDKVGRLLSEIEEAKQLIDEAKGTFELRRAAILNKAFRGELTEKWRTVNNCTETPEIILEKIKEKSKITPKKLDRSVINEYIPEVKIPPTWKWVQFTEVIEDLTDYHANGSYKVLKEHVELLDKPDYAFMIRATNFEKNNFSDLMKYITESAYNFMSRSKLYGGEILISKIGNTGSVYLMPNLNKPCSLAMNLFALRISEYIDNEFIYYYLKSPMGSRFINKYVKGVTTTSIDKKSVRSVWLPLPPLEEQIEIKRLVKRINGRQADEQKSLKAAVVRMEDLKHSILSQAFRGELGTNDPSEENAIELLKEVLQEQVK